MNLDDKEKELVSSMIHYFFESSCGFEGLDTSLELGEVSEIADELLDKIEIG